VKPDEMPIRTLAAEVGVSTATINFYVQEGVLPAPRKLNRTRAAYSSRHLRLLRVIKAMQASGYSLAQVKGAFATFGVDEKGLKRMESIGSLQPYPAMRADRDQRPIEPFAPLDRAAFVAKVGAPRRLVDELVHSGLLRPLPGDLFDARDAVLVRGVQSMVGDGIEPDELAFMSGFVALAELARPVIFRRGLARKDELLARTLRFRDLLEPFTDAFAYYFDRLATVEDPSWRTALFTNDGDAPTKKRR
jgi:DNA-binding transcriptional MerR regulator